MASHVSEEAVIHARSDILVQSHYRQLMLIDKTYNLICMQESWSRKIFGMSFDLCIYLRGEW